MDKEDKQVNDWISDLVGAICDPIIVFESPWKDTLPDWLPGHIKMDRMLMLMKHHKTGEKLTGTDPEALAYMYPASLEFPLDHDWGEIYLYLGTKVIPFGRNIKKEDYPEDIKKETLNNYQMGLLNHLKAWIYEQRIKVREDRERGERREEKEQEVKEKVKLQPALFSF